MRRIALLALTAAGIFGYRRWREAEEGRKVWDSATDSLNEDKH
ncbi:DLW-39 family protein [Nesterenkonia aerolata]|uniref:DLW-39 family protein n=1 Tax=Nesterenkonia aerolata TaxID=3074079 RepID=A0ABU2DTB7_9MICC|nr:DLW-39 family protein [Nesterenkonia sp. LY-0111]MDR8019743.1 DLW-39 family protein [Nesterenkonia sp. LY-0111]